MAKEQVQQEVKELVVDAHFIMRSFDSTDSNGNSSENEYVAFELIDPFNDEDFRNVALKAKWDKYDDKNRLVRPDRVFGYMSYYAKKALRTNPEVRVKVTIKPVNYKSKKTGKMVTYPGIFAEPTFVELADERPVEMVVKGAKYNNIFGLLSGQALGIKFASKVEMDAEDMGLL